MEKIELLRHIALLALSVVCVYTDIARGRLYNWATFGGIALGLATAFLLDSGVPGLPHLQSAFIAMVLGGGVLFLLHLTGGLGAGDVKFMAAIGALAPIIPGRIGAPGFVVWALVYAGLVGAAMAIGLLIWRGKLLQGIKDSLRTLVTFRLKSPPGAAALTIPYGVAIGIGAVWAWMEVVL